MISEEKVDSFNIPLYMACVQQVEEVVKRNGRFSIEIMESQSHENPPPRAFASVLRAGLEGLIIQHFGDEIDLDKLFDLYCKKCEELSLSTLYEPEKAIILFILLKRMLN